jgi:thiamine-monophosphate kinase
MRELEALKLLYRRLSVGDDCAIIPFENANLVFTTDMLHQATDFPRGTTAYTIGWRTAAVSLSDIAAMGGQPLGLLVALGAPEFERHFLEELLEGLENCCTSVKAKLLGGDLDHHQELTLVSTGLGIAARPVPRSGAKPGEAVCVTGALGRTAVALRLFEAGQIERANELFCFPPRVPEGLALGEHASSMIDISDGLARSLYQLAEASGAGFEIEYDKLPILLQVEELTQRRKDQQEMVLHTGEDFELLFTLPQGRLKDAQKSCEFTVIGHVLKERNVQLRLNEDLQELEDRGYQH